MGLVSVHRGESEPPGLRLVETGDPLRWARASSVSGQPVTAFHSFEWLRLAAAMTGTRFVPLVVTLGAEDIGIAPLLLRRRALLSLANWVPFPYLGPLVPAAHLSGCLDALRRREIRYGVIRQQQSFPVGATVPLDVLTERRFSVQNDTTIVVDTCLTEEELWAALEGRCRTAIRKAEQLGVTVQEAADTTTLGAVVELVFAARGLRSGYEEAFPPGLQTLDGLAAEVHSTVAICGGEEVGALVSLVHDRAGLIWQGGVLPAARATHANVMLYWDAIRWAHSAGAVSVDLVGLPDDGIRRFKSQFGGSLREYVVARRSSWLARGIESDLAARLRGRRVRTSTSPTQPGAGAGP